MRICYLSVHEILERSEVAMFKELGHYVFSPGACMNPLEDGLRPHVDGLQYDPEDVRAYHELGHQVHMLANWKEGTPVDNKDLLTKQFIDRFDVVVIMHWPNWITKSWDVMKHKHVVWRTIGQSAFFVEEMLAPYRPQGLKIVRYSPAERRTRSYIGEDAVIRFHIDPNDYSGWTGEQKQVVNVTQAMTKRQDACSYRFFKEVTEPFLRKLYGPCNEEAGELWGGKLPYAELKEVYRKNRVYFYTGTKPASYTLNFMEAWMTGIPIVAIGPEHGDAPDTRAYEVPELITNEQTGFVSDSRVCLREYIRSLLEDDQLAAKISQAGRQAAISYFDKAIAKQQWKAFFDSL